VSDADLDAGELSVSTLELFFDLVFVFTVTQLTQVLSHDLHPRGLLHATLILLVVWWMYDGYCWLTNSVPPDRPSRRLVLLAGMAAFLLAAMALPRAFGDGGVAFGLAYLLINALHALLYSRTTVGADPLRAVLRFGPLNLGAALLVLAAGFVNGWPRTALWLGAAGVHLVIPYVSRIGGLAMRAGHIVERHGLVVIIALGEAVVAIGLGAEGRRLGTGLALVAVLGLALAACLWWVYFGGDDDRAAVALESVGGSRRTILVLNAYAYTHVAILLGVVCVATGMKRAIAHPGAALPWGHAVALSGGVVLFLAGEVAFRAVLRLGRLVPRLLALPVLAATAAAGKVAAGWQLSALVTVLAVLFAAEVMTNEP
jgi:low temperature requirement protein LtrA